MIKIYLQERVEGDFHREVIENGYRAGANAIKHIDEMKKKYIFYFLFNANQKILKISLKVNISDVDSSNNSSCDLLI